jgi:hypothetical protein
MTGVSTPMAGICNLTGTERPRACAALAEEREGGGVLLGRAVVSWPARWPPQLTSSEAIAAVAKARLESNVMPRSPAGDV